jgi:integrase
MARVIGKLTAMQVSRLPAGMHGDGGGLYLHVNGAGARSWIFRFMLDGRARQMGLGPVHTVGLAEARKRAGDARMRRLDGVDPIEARAAGRTLAKIEAAKTITFKACAHNYIDAHRADWRNPKHAAQWDATLTSYVYPVFGALPVGAVDVGLVLKAIEPIWNIKTETATRVRGRIESILDWATARGYREGENPARWRGHLDHLLAAPSKAKRAVREKSGRDEHQAAMPYAELGTFMAELRQRNAGSARAIEFVILTAMRTETTLGALAGEIDYQKRIWTIPAGRPGLKRDGNFEVPLSEPALIVLHAIGVDPVNQPNRYIFPGAKPGRPLTNILKYLKDDMQRPAYTVHGFRSTFNDWASECTEFDEKVIQMALAHKIPDKVEAAYRRGGLIEKRRQLMDAWARFCAAPAGSGDVVPLRGLGGR